MLALVAVLLASLFGIAALVIDLGLAGASRLELESAADAAVLGVAPETLLADARAEHAEAAARGDVLAIAAPRAVAGADGQLGFERRVPLLFGHGSAIAFASPELGEQWLTRQRGGELLPEIEGGGLRESGFAAGATRVLRRERRELALRVGVAHALAPGRADVAIDAACWSPSARALVLSAASEEGALALARVEPADAAIDAACPRSRAAYALAPASAIQWIGDRVGEEIPTAPVAPAPSPSAYVPLVAGDSRRVIAFGAARVSSRSGEVVVERASPEAARNASALRVSAEADPARDARLAEALGERARWLEARPGADVAWLRVPVLLESAP